MLRIPKPHHHRASGQARLNYQGRQHYLGKWGSPEAESNYRKIVGNLAAAGVAAPRQDATVGEVAGAYLSYARDYYRYPDGRPTPQVVRIQAALAPMLELHSATPVSQFGPLALMAVRERMVSKGWCRRLVNHHVGCLKRAFKWAASRELCSGEVWHRLQSVEGLKLGRTSAPEPEPIRPVALSEVEKILPHLAPPVAAMVQLQLLAGMRPGEVVRMTSAEIDRQGPEGCWVYRPAWHKTAWRGRSKEILLGPLAQAVLAPFLLKHPEGPLFRPEEAMAWHQEQKRAKRKTPVQPSQQNRAKGRKEKLLQPQYSRDSYRRAINYACKRAGVPSWSPHRLRHTKATEIRQKFGLEEARAVLGHTSTDVTLVYAQKDASVAARVMRQIG